MAMSDAPQHLKAQRMADWFIFTFAAFLFVGILLGAALTLGIWLIFPDRALMYHIGYAVVNLPLLAGALYLKPTWESINKLPSPEEQHD